MLVSNFDAILTPEFCLQHIFTFLKLLEYSSTPTVLPWHGFIFNHYFRSWVDINWQVIPWVQKFSWTISFSIPCGFFLHFLYLHPCYFAVGSPELVLSLFFSTFQSFCSSFREVSSTLSWDSSLESCIFVIFLTSRLLKFSDPNFLISYSHFTNVMLILLWRYW